MRFNIFDEWIKVDVLEAISKYWMWFIRFQNSSKQTTVTFKTVPWAMGEWGREACFECNEVRLAQKKNILLIFMLKGAYRIKLCVLYMAEQNGRPTLAHNDEQ